MTINSQLEREIRQDLEKEKTQRKKRMRNYRMAGVIMMVLFLYFSLTSHMSLTTFYVFAGVFLAFAFGIKRLG